MMSRSFSSFQAVLWRKEEDEETSLVYPKVEKGKKPAAQIIAKPIEVMRPL
jgi:hypothetical protein